MEQSNTSYSQTFSLMQGADKTVGQWEPLEVFDNPHPERRYHVVIRCPEYTSVCPKTGLPDFGTITINYVPDLHCVELKSLKYYLLGYRNHGAFYETVVNKIMTDVIKACDPHWIEVQGAFTPRGGIDTTVTVQHQKNTS